MGILDDLQTDFGDYLSDRRASDWATVKRELPVLASVTGVVVRRYEFGVFVDISLGFPALILVVDLERPAERPSAGMEAYAAIGESITARVLLFADGPRGIRLIQRGLRPEELASMPGAHTSPDSA